MLFAAALCLTCSATAFPEWEMPNPPLHGQIAKVINDGFTGASFDHDGPGSSVPSSSSYAFNSTGFVAIRTT